MHFRLIILMCWKLVLSLRHLISWKKDNYVVLVSIVIQLIKYLIIQLIH